MLEYIKQQLAERYPTPTFAESNPEADNDELVVEYAHIFQELDDISVEGADAHRSRALELDIPVEEDVELDTVELNLMDNRLMDVPMDVTAVTEHFNESMKTYDDFYQEACNMIQPFMREDEYHLHERRTAYAKQHYDEYHEQMVQEGMFGFDKFPITNSNVPTNIMRDFGPLSPDDESQRYMVKLPVEFEIDDNLNIMQSQLDALRVSKTVNVFESFADVIREKLYQEFDCRIDDVWSMVTPKRVIVPTPKDNYEIIVEFECDGMDEPIYEGWSYARKPSVRNQDLQMYPHGKLNQMIENMITMNKRDYVKPIVHQETTTLSRWNNDSMYQESTKGYVAGMSFLELLAAAGVGGLIGYGAGSLVELVAISSMPFVAQMLASAGIGGIAGAGVGITAIGVVTNTDTIIKRNIDTVMAKNVTKCINAVIKTLAADSDTENKTISNLKKFKKASDKLAKELDYNTSKNHSYRGVLNKRELPENVKTAFDELKELAVKAATSVDIHANNKDFLKNYFKKMEAVLELMYDKDAIKSTFDDTKKTDAAINQESYAENSFMSIIQEAIDFGYPDETSEANKQNQPSDVPPAPDADPSAPTVNADPNANPDGGNVDNMEQPPVDDPNAAPPVEGEEKQPVDTNDVSDQIADKVSDETTNDNQDTGVDANGDISLDDSTETPDESATDTPEMDAGGFDNIDSSLDDLDNTTSSTDDTTMGDPANMDINSMSIDDIMAQAAEKLKSMPIDQVKQFLSDGVSSGLNTTPDLQTESYQQEAFFITKHNVKKELNAWIKKCLGDLNMSDKSLNEIIKAFKSSGKKLNRVLSKALKMNDIFNPEQMSHLNALNSALVKLQTGLQPTASAEETNVVKGLIRAFTDEAAIVGKFVSQ